MKLLLHIIIAWVLRIMLIIYGEWHDANMHLPFTDIDYHVFTDAARHVSEGGSPYNRSTYRYPPILAVMLLPNIWIHKCFGKILFATVDVIAGSLGVLLSSSDSPKSIVLLMWLYNPLPAIVSSRGNADSLTAALVAWALLCIRRKNSCISGILLGLAAHMRIYPVLFSLPIWLSAGNIELLSNWPKRFSIKRWFTLLFSLIFEPSRILFLCSLSVCLSLLTIASYFIYGHEFLQESYFYHLTRMDTRHNFSVHFYMLYLGGSQILSLLAFIPQLISLVLFGIKYGNSQDVPFACFCQAFVFVAFNKVMTAQYFLWPLSLLPAILPVIGLKKSNLSISSQKKGLKWKAIKESKEMCDHKEYMNVNYVKIALYLGVWSAALGLWLFSAYLLEFLGLNTFILIWIAGLIFFGSNIFVLRELVKAYENNTRRETLS
ncbi:hypothetical protein J437_LFUL008993, partial [Ladona fulva]